MSARVEGGGCHDIPTHQPTQSASWPVDDDDDGDARYRRWKTEDDLHELVAGTVASR